MCEDREKLPVSRRQAMLALQICCRDPRPSPRASGREGKAGWGPLTTGLSGSGERLTRRAFHWDRAFSRGVGDPDCQEK